MDLFTEGQKLALLFTKDSNIVEMTCTVENIWDDRLDLILPQYFMRYIEFLQEGKELTAKAFSKFGTVDFNTIVISSPLEDCFSIELDYNAVRLTSGEDFAGVKAIENIEIITHNEVLKLKTFELSTEHVRFYCDKKLPLNEEIECTLKLPRDYGTINFKAIVSEIDPIYDNEHTAVYMTMTEAARQTLLYYMYMYDKDTD